jgi:ribosomal protein S27E
MVGGNVGGSIVTGNHNTVTTPSGAQATLPARCPHCGATLRPDQVTWLSDTAAQCSHCGDTVVKT